MTHTHTHVHTLGHVHLVHWEVSQADKTIIKIVCVLCSARTGSEEVNHARRTYVHHTRVSRLEALLQIDCASSHPGGELYVSAFPLTEFTSVHVYLSTCRLPRAILPDDDSEWSVEHHHRLLPLAVAKAAHACITYGDRNLREQTLYARVQVPSTTACGPAVGTDYIRTLD